MYLMYYEDDEGKRVYTLKVPPAPNQTLLPPSRRFDVTGFLHMASVDHRAHFLVFDGQGA